MKPEFNVRDHVEWNSETGLVRRTIKKKIPSAITCKTYTVRVSKEEPQYSIKSDKTDQMAMHKGATLTKTSKSAGSFQVEPEETMNREKHDDIFRGRNMSARGRVSDHRVDEWPFHTHA